jgi:undecaprenyl-diphosphatase
MTWWQAALLGVVQGVTEFLPVSSSGHLVLFSHYLGIVDNSLLFEVVVHVATLGAIVAFFNTSLLRLSKREVMMVAVGTIPAAIVGLGFEDMITGLFNATWIVSVALMVTGVMNLFTDRRLEKNTTSSDPSDSEQSLPKTLSSSHSLVVGLFQALAIVPGISRSGSTVFSGLYLGLDREAAFRFSFLLAIPAIGGAGLLQAADVWQQGLASSGLSPGSLVIGGMTAFVSVILLFQRKKAQ